MSPLPGRGGIETPSTNPSGNWWEPKSSSRHFPNESSWTRLAKLSRHTEREFPVPFWFVDSTSKYVGKDGVPMNRAARRAADKQERRERKNSRE